MAKTKKIKESKATYVTRARRTNDASRTNGARGAKTRASKKVELPERRVLGKYIVADPKICHGKVTFIGTRIFVADIIEMVAEEMPWDQIIREWHGHITKEAIAEAVLLAYEAFAQYVDKPRNRSIEI